MLQIDREILIREVSKRVHQSVLEHTQGRPNALLELLNDTVYHEQKRLKHDRNSLTALSDSEQWKHLQRSLPQANPKKCKQLLQDAVEHFAEEIAGNFNPYVYRASVRLVPLGLSL
ncbi:MAG: hypothetical protein AAGJ35_02170, partial [Myxococcota bacterium]